VAFVFCLGQELRCIYYKYSEKEVFMKNVFIMIVLVSGLVFAGCSSKHVVPPEQPAQLEMQKQAVVPAKEPPKQLPQRPPENITDQQLAKVETTEEAPMYSEEKSPFEDIHFDYDKYEIQTDAQVALKSVSSWLLKNPSARLLIEGHCDERGTNEYNLALADRRAKSVRDYLIALGIASARVEMVSYGKEKPICTEHTEGCWAKNRRAHFVILREAGK
jgi:peptidoglycan-associated lipoprotein